MPRRKVTLALIENARARKASFRKRKASLLKKAEELTILCDIDASVIIYGPDDAKPVAWPSPAVANELLLRLQNMPVIEQHRKMVNQEAYMRDQVNKIQGQVLKHQKRNERDITALMNKLHDEGKSNPDFEISELMHLLCFVDKKIKEVSEIVGHFEQHAAPTPPPPCLSPLQNASLHKDGCGSNKRSNMGLPPYPCLGDIAIGANDMVLPQENFKTSTGRNNLGLVYGSSSGGIRGNYTGQSYGNFDKVFGGNDMMLPSGSFGNNNGRTNIEIGLPFRNFTGPAVNVDENNTRLGLHQRNFKVDNGEDEMRTFDGNSVDTGNGRNLGIRLPTHEDFASGSEGSDFGVPLKLYGESSCGSDLEAA